MRNNNQNNQNIQPPAPTIDLLNSPIVDNNLQIFPALQTDFQNPGFQQSAQFQPQQYGQFNVIQQQPQPNFLEGNYNLASQQGQNFNIPGNNRQPGGQQSQINLMNIGANMPGQLSGHIGQPTGQFNNQWPQNQFGGYQQHNFQMINTPNSNQGINQQNFSNSKEDKELNKIVDYIFNLRNSESREEALQELSKMRENHQNLAKIIWHSSGTVAILIQELVSIYSQLYPPTLNQKTSTKICSVLGLLQCLALHPETKHHFLNAHIPLFLYPFLNTSTKSKPFENLRVTSLGVIGALVKGDDSDAIKFLMQTEIIPLCLRIMKRGQELSRTVATFIVQKILLDENGLNYICQTAERFFAVSTVLQSMVEEMVQNGSNDQRLLRHIIRCYLRLSENSRANEALYKCLPKVLQSPTESLIMDDVVKKWYGQLMENLQAQQ